MAVNIVTTEDLQTFKQDLFEELKKIITENRTQGVRKWRISGRTPTGRPRPLKWILKIKSFNHEQIDSAINSERSQNTRDYNEPF